MKRLYCIALVAMLGTGVAHAERVFLPVRAAGVPGANGSLWVTKVLLTNHSSVPVQVTGFGECSIHPCTPDPLPPESTVYPASVSPFLHIDSAHADDVTVHLRVQDVSRQAETWGTTVPIVRERDLFIEKTLSLTDIVQNDDFRSMLRIYDFDVPTTADQPPRQVEVKIYGVRETNTTPATPDVLLLSRREPLLPDPSAPVFSAPTAQLSLWALPELAPYQRLRIEITSATPGLRFWAFTSITNNATQHVTVIAPR